MTEQQRHLPSASMELEKIGVHPAMHGASQLSYLVCAAIKKYHAVCLIYNRNLFSYNTRGLEVQEGGAAELMSCEIPLPDL